jgi:hypothetical protein
MRERRKPGCSSQALDQILRGTALYADRESQVCLPLTQERWSNRALARARGDAPHRRARRNEQPPGGATWG